VLQELARTGEAIALERPDGRALELRLGVFFPTGTARLDGELLGRSTVTYRWHSP
jgi:hypothetical protein